MWCVADKYNWKIVFLKNNSRLLGQLLLPYRFYGSGTSESTFHFYQLWAVKAFGWTRLIRALTNHSETEHNQFCSEQKNITFKVSELTVGWECVCRSENACVAWIWEDVYMVGCVHKCCGLTFLNLSKKWWKWNY